jgi:hypothetical protein
MAHQHTIYLHSSSPPQKLSYKSSSRGLKYLGRHCWRPADKLQKVCTSSITREFSRGCCYWMANTCFLFADAKHRPHGAIGSEVEGVGNATTGSVTDKLTREHRMTLDEAHLILNTKHGEAVERILQVRPSVLPDFVHRQLRANFCDLELRTLVQSQLSGGSATNKCARRTGRPSAFTLLAVKGGAGTGADRGRTRDSTRRTASDGIEISRDNGVCVVCWQDRGNSDGEKGPVAEDVGCEEIGLEKKGRNWESDRGRRFCWRTSRVITACDQKSAWPLIKFILSFACGSLGIMLATATTNTLTSTFRWSFSFFDTRIEFRSMFIATLFLFLFLCLGQYSYFPP